MISPRSVPHAAAALPDSLPTFGMHRGFRAKEAVPQPRRRPPPPVTPKQTPGCAPEPPPAAKELPLHTAERDASCRSPECYAEMQRGRSQPQPAELLRKAGLRRRPAAQKPEYRMSAAIGAACRKRISSGIRRTPPHTGPRPRLKKCPRIAKIPLFSPSIALFSQNSDFHGKNHDKILIFLQKWFIMIR